MALSDTPLDFSGKEPDLLHRMPSVRALERMLASDRLDTPLVVGVYGGWGTGKTSVMRTLRAILASPDRLDLWFDAWIYARQEQVLWRALLLRVVTALREWAKTQAGVLSEVKVKEALEALDEAQERLYRSMTVTSQGGVKVNWWGALPLATDAVLTAVSAGLNPVIAKALAGENAEGGVATALAKWLKGSDTKEVVRLLEREASERHVEQVTSLEQFRGLLRNLFDIFEIGQRRKLLVFVDDLDRCLPEDAVAALEAIKLFLDLEGCVFVLGMDREVVEQGIRIRYREIGDAAFDARAYLDKIIQVPFNLPQLGPTHVRQYLHGLRRPAAGAFAACSDLFEQAAPPNPRTLKRALNALLLALYLDGFDDAMLANPGTEGELSERVRRLAKIVLLQVCFGPAWWAILTGRCSLKNAEAIAQGAEWHGDVDGETRKLFEGSAVRRLFRSKSDFRSLSDEDIEALLTLSRVMQSGSNSSPHTAGEDRNA